MIEKILSVTNEKIKMAVSLKEKKYRDKLSLFIGEGVRFSEMAINSDFEIISAFFEPRILENSRNKNLMENLKNKSVKLYEVTEKIMQKISNTKTPQGIVLVIKQKNYSLENIKNAKIIVALNNLKDPGNAGTIVRLSDAVGAGAVVLTKNSVDLYSDKVIRSTMGSVFNVPIIKDVDVFELLNFAKKQNLKIYATKMNAPVCYEQNLKDGGIFVFGSESEGVGEEILNAAENISLPIAGKAESLNVASAASAILYEVYRQQNF